MNNVGREQRLYAITLLEIAGLTTDQWIPIDQLSEVRSYLILNQEEIGKSLPKYVIGNLGLLHDDSKYKRSILSLIRRLALFCSSILLRTRLKDIKKKTIIPTDICVHLDTRCTYIDM